MWVRVGGRRGRGLREELRFQILLPQFPPVDSYLELMRLQFAIPCFGGEGRHVGADGGESFGVRVEHDGRDETVGRAHCHTQVHHVVPKRKQQ